MSLISFTSSRTNEPNTPISETPKERIVSLFSLIRINKSPLLVTGIRICKFKKFVNASKLPVPLRLEIHNLMNHFEIQKIINPDILNKVDLHQPSRLLSMSYKEAQGESWLNKLLCMDLKWVLADNDLIKVRSACQMNDLNVGFPLLDERLIKFALKLPDHYKLRNQHLRPFFKRAMQDFLPKTILQKQKHGFSVPVGQWILNNASLRAYTMDTLSEFKKREFLSASFIDDLKDRLLMEHPGYYGVMVWLIVVLELWLQTKQYAISHLDANHYWMEQTA